MMRVRVRFNSKIRFLGFRNTLDGKKESILKKDIGEKKIVGAGIV